MMMKDEKEVLKLIIIMKLMLMNMIIFVIMMTQ